ncbi:MAG TPA: 3'-5' exonuclease, partial [Planctomycetota bacterium]|nr:3'-5' exonuclease [Planctomycetota bacterium]
MVEPRSGTVAYDIEVAGLAWEEIDESTRGYLLERERDPAERAKVPERTALYPGCGRVVAVGLWEIEKDRGAVFADGKGGKFETWERVPGSKIFRGGEAEILARFWKEASAFRTLVSFNGRG